MPDVLPTINNEPPQGIQALLDTVYLWNPDVANDLIEKINDLLGKLDGLSGKIPPYAELEAPVAQYTPCYNGDNVYVAAQDLEELPQEFNPLQWILIATKAPVLTAGDGIEIEGNQISVTQAIAEGASAGATAVQPGDLGTAAYAATTDFATAAQGAKADTALQPGSSVPQYVTMPQPTGTTNGRVVQYSGPATSGFTTGYFYKEVPVTKETVSPTFFEEGEVSPFTISIDNDRFLAACHMSYSGDWSNVDHIRISYQPSEDSWEVAILTAGNVVLSESGGINTAYWGVTIDGTPDYFGTEDMTYSPDTLVGYTWEQVNVQDEPTIGRFLALWNCATGLAETNPPTSPYEYRAGDYFIVGTVDSTTNYKPAGTSYVIGTASSTVETAEVSVGDSYFFDGTNWRLQSNSNKTVTFANVAGDIYDNLSAATALNTKQDTLVSGTNIKSINGNSILGSGNLDLSTVLPYPAGWPTTGTTKAFCDAIAADSSATKGKYYLGEVRLSDLPGGIVNSEVEVKIMDGTTAQNKVIVLTLTSGNVAPYLWQYTYWNNGSSVSGWIGFQTELPSQTGNAGKFLKTNGSTLSWAEASGVPQYTTMPMAAESNVDEIAQYSGPDVPDEPASATITQTVGSGLSNLAVNVNTFVETEQPTGDTTVDFVANVIPDSFVYSPNKVSDPNNYLISVYASYFGLLKDFYFLVLVVDDNNNATAIQIWSTEGGFATISQQDLVDNNVVISDVAVNDQINATYVPGTTTWKKDSETVDLADYGITFTGTPSNNDELEVDYSAFVKGWENGYFYKNEPVYADPAATISQTVGSGLTDLSVDVDAFIEAEQPAGNTSVDFVYSAVTETLTPTTFTYSTMSLSVDTATFLEKLHDMYTGDYSILKRVTIGFNGTYWIVAGWLADGGNLFMWDDITSSGIDIAWGVTVTGTEVATASTDEFSMTYIPNSNIWVKGGTPVDIANYGVTYSGTPVIDDVLRVVYTASTVSGYEWNQKNVQPAGGDSGIEWKAVVDLPGTWSGDIYNAFPYYTIVGGLPDGEYEFYFSTKTTTEGPEVPLGDVIFKAFFTIDNTARTAYGRLGYVFNGDYMNDANTIFGTSSVNLWSLVRANGSDLIFVTSERPWSSAVLGYNNQQTVPGCFKMSAVKNVETGEEYIPVGAVNTEGGWPSYDYQYSGSFVLKELANPPYLPSHFAKNQFVVADSNVEYLYLNGIILSGSWEYAKQVDLSMSLGTDVFNAYLEVTTGSGYEWVITDATGVFENVQMGFTSVSAQPYLKLNFPANTSGTLFVVYGLNGTAATGEAYVGVATQADNFTPLNALKVGETPVNPLYLGKVLQYKGTTNANYTNGYFYKVTGTIVTTPQSYTPYDVTPAGCTVSVDIDDLIPAIQNTTGWGMDTLTYYLKQNFQWDLYIEDGVIQWVRWGAYGTFYNSDIIDCFTATSINTTETIYFYATYTPESRAISGGAWTRVDVQPSGGGSSLPTQTNHEGQFLFTDGTNASWKDSVYTHTATHTFTYDENTPEHRVTVVPKTNRDCWVKCRVYYTVEPNPGYQETYFVRQDEIFFDHRDLIDDASWPVYSKARTTSCSDFRFQMSLWCDKYSSDLFQYAIVNNGFMPGETFDVTIEIEYSDGVNNVDFTETMNGWDWLNIPDVLLSEPSQSDEKPVFPIYDQGQINWNNIDSLGLDFVKHLSEAPTDDWEFENMGNNLWQYVGETDQDYTNGYFYGVGYTDNRNAVATVMRGTFTVSIDQAVFAANSVDVFGAFAYTGDYVYDSSLGGWRSRYSYDLIDMAACGITITGTLNNNDYFELAFDSAYKWVPKDVQPAPTGFLPLSGGTMTGPIEFQGCGAYNMKITASPTSSTALLFSSSYNNHANPIWFDFGNNTIMPGTDQTGSLGQPYYRWGRICVATINNGTNNNISVPATSGTMAVIGVNTTITLASANWSSNTQTVNVTGMTATGVVLVSPIPADQADYTSAGITCSAQGSGTLTFTCDTAPSSDIDVTVVML